MFFRTFLCYMPTFQRQDPLVSPLELEGFPADTAFHPHGMHFRRETGELFVINHAYAKGGERIDVFKVGRAAMIIIFFRYWSV